MKARIGLSLLLPFLLAADTDRPSTAIAFPEPLEPLQGEWKLVRGSTGGRENLGLLDLRITGEVLTSGPMPVGEDWRLRISFSRCFGPKEIDFESNGSEGVYVFRAIYKLEGAMLTVCLHTDGKVRPKAFSVEENEEANMFIWKKVSKKSSRGEAASTQAK
jgi:uncharacterized protein (TIGR03067 family)